MIEISLGKMVLLALIALIVLGPEKLPGAARTAGALMRRVRSGWDNVRAEVERELEIEEIKRTAREAAAQAEAAQNAMKDTLQQAHEPLADAAAMIKDARRAGTAMDKVGRQRPESAEVVTTSPADEEHESVRQVQLATRIATGRAIFRELPTPHDQGAQTRMARIDLKFNRIRAGRKQRQPRVCSRGCSRICWNCARACSSRWGRWCWCWWRWCRLRIACTANWPRRW